MDFLSLAVLGLVIGSNNLATALALGALGQAVRRLRVITVFGLFEFFIPLVGLWIGRTASHWIEEKATWVSTGLLGALGLWMILAGIRQRRKDARLAERITTWRGLVLLSTGLSLDNLVIGFSLGLGDAEPLLVAGTIAVFSVAFTWGGLHLGSAARSHWERFAEIGAGLLLIALAVAKAVGWI